MKKTIHIILLILWLLTIFTFSNQTGTSSDKTSEGVLSKIVSKDSYIYNHSKRIIRKFAHMTEYAILTILTYFVVNDYIKKGKIKYLIVLLFPILISISDEIHQLFIAGRCCSVVDMCIDSFGTLTITMLLIFINKKTSLFIE